MLFKKKIDPSCTYCARGSRISNEQVVCTIKGVLSSGSSCRRFKYDPLRRVPSSPVLIDTEKLSEDDFIL